MDKHLVIIKVVNTKTASSSKQVHAQKTITSKIVLPVLWISDIMNPTIHHNSKCFILSLSQF